MIQKTIILLLLSLASSIGFSQTQLEMNMEAKQSFEKADKELNAIYMKILKEYKKDIPFLQNLKKSQKIWIQFRDAEMKMKFPDREDSWYGSVQPMCWSSYQEKLTKERTKTLKTWLIGMEEGDGCSCSVKNKE